MVTMQKADRLATIYGHIFYGAMILFCLSYGTTGMPIAGFYTFLYVGTIHSERINAMITKSIMTRINA